MSTARAKYGKAMAATARRASVVKAAVPEPEPMPEPVPEPTPEPTPEPVPEPVIENGHDPEPHPEPGDDKNENEPDDETEDAATGESEDGEEAVTLDAFEAYMPMHNYIFKPARTQPWPAISVDARLPVQELDPDGNLLVLPNGKPKPLKASQWLDKYRPVEQMTWAPGHPYIIKDKLINEGGWSAHQGVRCVNLYVDPPTLPGDPSKAGPWIELVRRVFPADADHIIPWLAQRVQRPEEKINHAVVLGGAEEGIGKDTILEPVKRAVGHWNFKEATPEAMLESFNKVVQATILRVSEASDLGEANRYAFHERMKLYIAAPPTP